MKKDLIKNMANKFNRKEKQIKIMVENANNLGYESEKIICYIDEFYRMIDNRAR